MKRRRHTPEQVIRKLREADRLLAEGKDVEDVARHLEVSPQTYHRWRNQFGGTPQAALRYQHATRERDAAIASAFEQLAGRPNAQAEPAERARTSTEVQLKL